MSKISIVGNGFDIRHGCKTTYNDFLNYCEKEGIENNVLYKFFSKMNNYRGWYDFEQDLLSFLIFFEELINNFKITSYAEYYQVKNNDIVYSPKSRIFFDVIKSMNYSFFQSSNQTQILIKLEDENWYRDLINHVMDDYFNMQNLLVNYLDNEVEKRIDEINLLNEPFIEYLRSSNQVFTFNYTSIIEKYNLKNIHYVHGSLRNQIILGIPASVKIETLEFLPLFKITQSIQMELNKVLFYNYSEDLYLYFFGFSFGESDHYFFQEVKDWINNYYSNKGEIPPIFFNIFYFGEGARKDFINNLRIFMGEEMLVRFDIKKQIRFIQY